MVTTEYSVENLPHNLFEMVLIIGVCRISGGVEGCVWKVSTLFHTWKSLVMINKKKDTI